MNDEREVTEELQDLMMYGHLPRTIMCDKVIQLGFKKKIQAICIQDYNKASEYDIALQKLSKLQSERELNNRKELIAKRNEQRKKALINKIAITTELYEKTKKENEEHYKNSVYIIETRHEKEFERFKTLWESPEYLVRFTKQSASLLQLRYIEKKQAILKEYIDARKTKKRADEMQRYEEAAAQAAVEEKMQKDYDVLAAKQEEELSRHEALHKKNMQRLQKMYLHEVDVITKSIQNIDKKGTGIVNSKFHSLKPSLQISGGNPYLADMNNGDDMEYYLLSPRTSKKLKEYRDTENYDLKIHPPTAEQIRAMISEFKPLIYTIQELPPIIIAE